MRSFLGYAALIAPVVGCVACGPNPSSGATPQTNQNMITYQQLQQHRFSDVYDAVEALHSNWLRTRGTDSFRTPSQVLVVMDDTQLGDVNTLHEINIKSVVYIEYFDGIAATARWGLDHGSGVIYVSTRNAPGPGLPEPPDTSPSPPDTGSTTGN